MKKIIIALLMIFAAFVFSANIIRPKADDGTIRIWVGAISREKEVMEDLAAEFKEKTGVTVKVYQKLEIFTVPAALVNNAELEERPDIVYMQAPDIGGLVKSGYLQPLEISAEMRGRFCPVAFEAFTFNNEVYGVGYSNSAYGLIYNKDLIATEDLPETWEDLFAKAEELTIADDDGNITQRGLYLNATDMWFNYPLIREYGGYYYGRHANGDYNAYDVGLDNPGMLDYVAKIKELKAKGMVLNNPNKKDYSDIIAEFAAGRVAMIFYGLWSAQIFQNAGVNYGIAPLPDNAKPITTVEGFVINKYTRNLPAARDFLAFILEDANQQRLIEAGNNYERKTGERNPTNISVIESDYIQSDEILRDFSGIGFNVEPFPNIPEGTLWYNQDVTTTAFRAIFFGDSAGNEVDAMYKLTELAEYIRRNVLLMNETAEYVSIPWWAYVLVSAAVIAGAAAYIILKRRKGTRPRERHSLKRTVIAWGVMIPFLVLLGMFYVYPIFHNFYLSFTNYSGVNLRDYGLVGFANYRQIFTEGVKGLLGMGLWTFVFAFSVIAISFIFGVLLATLLETAGMKVARVYRLIYILPWVIPAVITLLMWQGLLETEGGLINRLLALVGLGKVPWLTNRIMARVSTVFVMVWFSFPYYMVVASGFLQSIPKEYYEAARIDGGSRSYIFFHITLPLVFKALIPTLIMGFIMQFNQFGVYMLTQGGPASDVLGQPGATDLLITYVFNTAFNSKRYALAATYSVVIFVFVAVFALITMRVNKKRMEA